MNPVSITVLTPRDWQDYKALRLASLTDSPDAFGSTFGREAQFTDEHWQSRLNPEGKLTRQLPLVARLNGAAVGLAWVETLGPEDRQAHLFQMWVSPLARGQGIGRRLLDQSIAWAGKTGLTAIVLSVTTTNIPAIELYRTMGFQAYGRPEALRDGSPLWVQPMKLALWV